MSTDTPAAPAPGTLFDTTLETVSSLLQLSRIRKLVRQGWQKLPHGTEGVEGFEIAATEAASNIMRHSYGGAADKPLGVRLTVTPDRVTLALSHEGIPLAADAIDRAADLEEPGEGGMGLALIRACTDAVEFGTDARGRHCLTLIKLIPPGAEGSDAPCK
jgi:serine/threonine-protein kinase RsbW